MDFEIDDDDGYDFDYLDSSNLSNLSSPKYSRASPRVTKPYNNATVSTNSYSASIGNKNVTRSSAGSNMFSSRADEEENPYDFDLNDTKRSYSKANTSSKDMIHSSKEASIISKMKESTNFSTMSSLDKAQSILSKYAQGNVASSTSSFKRASEIFDEDDISIDSAHDEDGDDDDDSGLEDFTSSVYVAPKKASTSVTSSTLPIKSAQVRSLLHNPLLRFEW
jgi:hypothetical protein